MGPESPAAPDAVPPQAVVPEAVAPEGARGGRPSPGGVGVSVAVVHYGTPDLLRECLQRLHVYAPKADVVVIDAGPDGRDGAAVTTEYGAARHVRVPNVSYAASVNRALRETSEPVFVQMNADVMIGPDTLPRLLAALEEPGVAMAGPSLFTPNGARQDQGLPYRWNYARLSLLRRAAVSVPWLSGCIQALRRDAVLAVGGMDETLRFYNEDMEWCFRFRAAGFDCRLVAAEVLHVGGAATPKNDERFLVEGFRGGIDVSNRYRPRWQREAHLRIARWIAQRERHEGGANAAAHARVVSMIDRRAFDTSPFGTTLEETEPDFLPLADDSPAGAPEHGPARSAS